LVETLIDLVVCTEYAFAPIVTLNPHQNDQGRKGPCCFQRLIALKCLKCQKIKKIYIPRLLSLLSSKAVNETRDR
jgi:hypothetical protein